MNELPPKVEAAVGAFQNLSPDEILDAVESQDLLCDGSLLALNSYENRVYQVGIEDQQPIIAKFYRLQMRVFINTASFGFHFTHVKVVAHLSLIAPIN